MAKSKQTAIQQHFHAPDRKKWRTWLQANHQSANEIWLVYFRKDSGKPSISYMESVEEALCFGWIDGIKKRIDEERYCHRFSPRRPGSKWTARNIALANKLIEAGIMSAAGLAAFQQRSSYSAQTLAAIRQKDVVLPLEIEKALKRNKLAWTNLNQLAPGYRRQYLLWLSMAKKPETRARRLQEALALLEQNRKLGMK